MFDEMERLAESGLLVQLLAHYGDPGAEDRETWQDRCMGMEGAGAGDLTRLHGELLAYDWIEQNTGVTPVCEGRTHPQCYRVTSAGLRALKAERGRRRRLPVEEQSQAA